MNFHDWLFFLLLPKKQSSLFLGIVFLLNNWYITLKEHKMVLIMQ